MFKSCHHSQERNVSIILYSVNVYRLYRVSKLSGCNYPNSKTAAIDTLIDQDAESANVTAKLLKIPFAFQHQRRDERITLYICQLHVHVNHMLFYCNCYKKNVYLHAKVEKAGDK